MSVAVRTRGRSGSGGSCSVSVLGRLEAATRAHGRGYVDQMAAVADIYAVYDGRHRNKVYRDPVQAAGDEIAALLGRGAAQADRLIWYALLFRDLLPSVLAHVASGRLTPLQAEQLAQRALNVTPELAGEVDRRVDVALSAGKGWSRARLEAMIDAIIAQVDADALRIRRRVALADRAVWCRNIGDGMAQLSITCDAAVGRTAEGAIRAAARGLIADGGGRTQAQVMSDVATAALLLGRAPTPVTPSRVMSLAAGSVAAEASSSAAGSVAAGSADSDGSTAEPDAAAQADVGNSWPAVEDAARQAVRRAADVAALEAVAGRVVVHVVANRSTVDDPTDLQPGFLPGYGVITADHVRDLAGRGRIAPLLPDGAYPTDSLGPSDIDGPPDGGRRDGGGRAGGARSAGERRRCSSRSRPRRHSAGVARSGSVPDRASGGPTAGGGSESVTSVPPRASQAADDYRPTAAAVRFLQVRDLTCRFPGCSRPAERCDVDHVDNHQAGNTTTANMGHLCRRHHLGKTHHGWRMEHLDNGPNVRASSGGDAVGDGGRNCGDGVVFVSPLGGRYPGPAFTGVDLFPGLAGVVFDDTPGATPTGRPVRRNRLAEWQARVRAERAYSRMIRESDQVDAAQRAAAERAAATAAYNDDPPPF